MPRDAEYITEWDHFRFEFPTPRTVYGFGEVKFLPSMLDDLIHSNEESCAGLLVVGSHALKTTGYLESILNLFEKTHYSIYVFRCGVGEASCEMVDSGVKQAFLHKVKFILGIGGGSVLDVGKAIAGVTTNGGSVYDYFQGKEFTASGLPYIAIPTTAGTAAEITPNAVLLNPTLGIKKSIRGSALLAQGIILDPELTLSCPPRITAYSGADALVQAIEAYTSRWSHPFSDFYALKAIEYIIPNIRKAIQNGNDRNARAQLLMGAHLAGIAFSQVRLGLVHGLAHPLGFKYHIAHGLVCGVLLPWVMEFNVKISAEKYAIIAQTLQNAGEPVTFLESATNEEKSRALITFIQDYLAELNIPYRLGELGVKSEDIPWIVAQTKGGSADANPRGFSKEQLTRFLHRIL